MLKRTLILVFIMSASLAFGQLDSNSITVTASQSENLQPDQVLFAVDVSTPLTASLDDVLAAVKGAGITSANFSGVYSSATAQSGTGTGNGQSPAEQWAFGLAVPFAQMKATVTTLTSLQQSITQASSGFTLSFSVQGTQVSTSLLQSQTCNIAGLIVDATAQAQKLATAAGLNLGSILAMSSNTSISLPGTPVQQLGAVGSLLVSQQLAAPQGCALTVKFGVTRF
jgi:uncharacterized protein YggE